MESCSSEKINQDCSTMEATLFSYSRLFSYKEFMWYIMFFKLILKLYYLIFEVKAYLFVDLLFVFYLLRNGRTDWAEIMKKVSLKKKKRKTTRSILILKLYHLIFKVKAYQFVYLLFVFELLQNGRTDWAEILILKEVSLKKKLLDPSPLTRT